MTLTKTLLTALTMLTLMSTHSIAMAEAGSMTLHQAVEASAEDVNSLLVSGASVNAANEKGVTPLMVAVCVKNNAEIIKILLEAGAEPNAKNNYGDTPLSLATLRGYMDNVSVLLEHGASIKADPNSFVFAARGGTAELVTRMLNAGGKAHLEATSNDGWTALAHAAFSGKVDVAKVLLAAGANVNHQDKVRYTPLMRASRTRAIGNRFADKKISEDEAVQAFIDKNDMVLALLEAGANPNLQNKDGETALIQVAREYNAHYKKAASYMASNSIFASLLQKGTNPNIQDKTGSTALMYAAGGDWTGGGRLDLVQLLLAQKSKLNLNLQNNRGETALMLAVRKGDQEITQALLAAGANPNIQNKQGKTTLTMAGNNADLQAVLRQHGAR